MRRWLNRQLDRLREFLRDIMGDALDIPDDDLRIG